MTDRERLDYLVGQNAVLEAFCLALISTHTDHGALREQFVRNAEYPIAKLLPTHASEAMLEGAQETRSKFLAFLSS